MSGAIEHFSFHAYEKQFILSSGVPASASTFRDQVNLKVIESQTQIEVLSSLHQTAVTHHCLKS